MAFQWFSGLVGDTPIFESAVICEYPDDTAPPRLHPDDALERAHHRAWVEFGLAFRYFDVFDTIGDFGFLAGLPKVAAWRTALSQRASVRDAARPDHADLLRGFLLARQSALSGRIAAAA